jgi:hypothetical protein
MDSIELPFSHPVINRIVKVVFRNAKTRRTVKVKIRTSVHIADYWDDGSRTYASFVQLSTMLSVSAQNLPASARQQIANPFNLAIADLEMQPGYAVVENVIFRGKDLGYRIILHPSDVEGYMPEAKKLLPEPEINLLQEINQ